MLSHNELREGKIEYLDAERRSQGGQYEESPLTEIVALWAWYRRTFPAMFRVRCGVFGHKTQKDKVCARIRLIGAAFVALCWLTEA